MEFQFAKYTEITDFAFKVNPEYQNSGYVRVFICPDVNDFWLVRILEGYNEEYEKEEGSYILERERFDKNSKSDNLTINKVRRILEEDEFGNWDIQQGYDLEKLVDIVDGGYGMLNRKEVVKL